MFKAIVSYAAMNFLVCISLCVCVVEFLLDAKLGVKLLGEKKNH